MESECTCEHSVIWKGGAADINQVEWYLGIFPYFQETTLLVGDPQCCRCAPTLAQ